MADEHTNAISAPFPDPPPFYKFFTPENVALQQQRADGREIAAEETPDLAYLVPPEPPASGKWTAFGTEYTVSTPDIVLSISTDVQTDRNAIALS